MNSIKKVLGKIGRTIYYRKCRRANNVKIDYSAIVNKDTKFEGYNVVHRKCVVISCFIGRGTYIHDGTNLERCKIGRWCSIAPNTKIIKGNHPIDQVSTHPIFYSNKEFAGLQYNKHNTIDEYSYSDERKKWYCEIGNDVWVGEDVRILNGIKIGNGAVIGAGALVTKNVPDYAVVGGVPAKIIKYRFDEETIKELLHLEWWNKDVETLRKEAGAFADVNSYIRNMK